MAIVKLILPHSLSLLFDLHIEIWYIYTINIMLDPFYSWDFFFFYVYQSKVINSFAILNFLYGINHLTFWAWSIIIFRDNKMKTWKLISQQYRAWSECTVVQAGMALYWLQRLINFIFGRIRVKGYTIDILGRGNKEVVGSVWIKDLFKFCHLISLLIWHYNSSL